MQRKKLKFGILILFLLCNSGSFCQNEDNSLSFDELCLTNNQFDDRYASYSGNGRQIVFESNRTGNWQIFVMEKNGSNQRQITFGKFEHRRPGWHPGGVKIVYEELLGSSTLLKETDLRTGEANEISLSHKFNNPLFPKYGPGGDKIAFSAKGSDSLYHLFIYNINTKLYKSVLNSIHKLHYPNWSADGLHLLFFSRMETENKDDEIYRYALTSKKLMRLTNWPKHNFCPSWSSDSKKIAYVTSMQGSRPEIYIMKSDGGQAQRITFNNDGDTLPNWAPDDQSLLITAYRNGNFEICEINLIPRE